MIEVDARGLSCPLPVVRTKNAIEKRANEDILVKVDSATPRDNIIRLIEGKGLEYSVDEKDEEFHIKISMKEG